MDLLAQAALVVSVLAIAAFAVLIAVFGIRTLTRARRRGRHVSELPTWYLGGQPDAQPPDDRRERR